jgi:hypothetical protein
MTFKPTVAAGTAVTDDTATTDDTAVLDTATDPYDPRVEDVFERVAAH